MKLEKTLNSKNIQSTGKVTAMKLNENAAAMVFSTFTSSVYSDPIGTVIREIASNCFDAHVEAGTDSIKNPVVVKINKELSEGHSISFIDKGVGMSPDRVYNIYGTYFNSTKNDTNDQIGGFGIGGKTPLAYTESFFVITRFDSIEYTYNVFEGNDSPMIELMSQKSTKLPNGTEVRVPIKSGDLDKFERKTLRQLFYFENIIFEGFSSYVINEYTITKGKTFLFRNSDLFNEMHVCLGKVAYPIDYEAMDLSSDDYSVPVAVNIEIGELDGTGVNISREALKYNTKNIKIIKKKMDAVKVELMQMLSKQHNNVQTLKDYYTSIKDLNKLILDGDRELFIGDIRKKDIEFPKFKYNDLKLPNYNDLLNTFYHSKTFGKKESTRYWRRTYGNSFESMKDFDNIYYVNGEFKRVVLKQSYIQYNSDRFFIHTPKKFEDTFLAILKNDLGLTVNKEIPLTKNEIKAKEKAHEKSGLDIAYFDDNIFKTKIINVIPKKKADVLIADLIKDVHTIMINGAKNYDSLVVPDDYIAMRKANRMSANVLKTGIPVKDMGNYHQRNKMTMKQFVNLKGKIYYGFADDSYSLVRACRIFNEISGNERCGKVNRYGTPDSKGTMFLQISKGNEKYLKMLGHKKAIHVDYFFETYVTRKVDMIIKNKTNAKAESFFNYNILPIFHNDVFEHIDKEIFSMARKVINTIGSHKVFYNVPSDVVMKKLNINLDNVQVQFKHKKELEELTKITNGCKDRLKWISFPYEIDPKNNTHKELIELVNLCIDK